MKRISNWTDQEDKFLLKLYNQADCFQKWKYISEKFYSEGFCKNEIQCRERFVNKLNPDLRQGKLEKLEVQSLFKYYDQYGPLWSVFESLIPGRSQNLLKNKFYSMLRSLVRILLASVDLEDHELNNFPTTGISSKLLVEIYEGKKKFRKYKGFLSSILKQLNYELDQEKFNSICSNNQGNQRIIKSIKWQIAKSIKSLKRTGVEKLNSDSSKKQKLPKKPIQKQKSEQDPTPQDQAVQKAEALKQGTLTTLSPPFGVPPFQPVYHMEAFSLPGYMMYFWGYYAANESQAHQKLI